MLPFGHKTVHVIEICFFADDIQLYISDSYTGIRSLVELFDCFHHITRWLLIISNSSLEGYYVCFLKNMLLKKALIILTYFDLSPTFQDFLDQGQYPSHPSWSVEKKYIDIIPLRTLLGIQDHFWVKVIGLLQNSYRKTHVQVFHIIICAVVQDVLQTPLNTI